VEVPEMRTEQLGEWVAGGLAGCPGTVVVETPGDPPTPARASAPTPELSAGMMMSADSRTEERPRRGRWVTVAAVILLAQGGLAFVYAPILVGGGLTPVSSMLILVIGFAVLTVAAGIGLLRLRDWARIAAGALASVSLLFMYLPALITAVANGVWLGYDWPGVVGYLVVLFAVIRRWPAERQV
jgi:hypothetical protein